MVEVNRYQRFVVGRQDARERARGSGADGAVDLLDRGVAGGGEGEVDERDVRRWYADGGAVELASKLRQHQADGPSGTR